MEASPVVLVVRGLPGAGKTTLVRAFVAASDREWRVLSRDEIRAALFAPCDWSEEEKERSFAALLDAADHHLARGRDLVLDGMPFTRVRDIERVRAIAERHAARVVVVEVRTPVELAQARVVGEEGHPGRERGPLSVVDVAQRFEPHLADVVLDGTAAVASNVDALRAATSQRPSPTG